MSTAVDKIHEFRRFGSVLGPERMNDVLAKLGDPQGDLKVIHVAGTNGKGSSMQIPGGRSQLMRLQCGTLHIPVYRGALNERIRLGGHDISDSDLEVYTDRVLAKVDELVSEGKDSPTEFERRSSQLWRCCISKKRMRISLYWRLVWEAAEIRLMW